MNNILNLKQDTEDHWVSISDLMTGLMMIFLFISVLYMLQVSKDKKIIEDDRNRLVIEKAMIEELAVTYERLQEDLYEDFNNEFKNDLTKWNAEINRQLLSIRFKEPDVLFEQGSSDVKQEFKNILDDFFPRYLKILYSDKYRDEIEEIRIEGHTSSEWKDGASDDEGYIKNMHLSQSRTRSVLEYILSLQEKIEDLDNSWLKKHLTANGLSSSRLIFKLDNSEDKIASRRVEFRVRTNAEKRIVEIIKRF